MPGLTSSLLVGLSGLQAHQDALNIIGNNITNVNSPGYSRQRANLTPSDSHVSGNFMFGSGVDLSQVQAIRDRFLELQVTDAISRQKGAETRFSTLEGISPVFNEDAVGSLGSLVQNFFQGFQDLSARPEDASVRTALIDRANAMITGFQTRYNLLRDQRVSADGSIGSYLTQVNALSSQIASLNQRIATELTPGADQAARDQRQQAVNQLSELVGVQTYEDSHEGLQVILEGGAAPLVVGSQAFTITGTPDITNSNFLKLQVQLGTPIDVTAKLKQGKIGANLDLRDNQLPLIQRRLDQLAAGITSQANLLHRAGFALDGVTTGTDFFLGSVANGANGLPTTVTAAGNYLGMVNLWAVNGAVQANPGLIAAASAANSVGNNVQAKAIANLQFSTSSVDTNGDGLGDTGPFSTYVSSLVGYIGSQTQAYESNNTTQENLLQALQAQRDRISGVDLDEEASNLLTMQRGYQASARFINVIDQLTDQLVNQFGK